MSPMPAALNNVSGALMRAAGEWAQIDRRGNILELSPDLADRLDPAGGAAALAAWPAIGSEERLVDILGQLRSGIPALTIPAADGRGMLAIMTLTAADGTHASHWQRCQDNFAGDRPSGRSAPTAGLAQLLNDTAARLSHDTIAPIRRSLAFVEVITTTDASLSATTQRHLTRVLDDLGEASALIRDIVATLRIPQPTTHEHLTVAKAITLGCAGCQAHAVEVPWTMDESQLLPIGPDLAEPLFTAVMLVAGVCRSEPRWTSGADGWQLAIATPWPAEIRTQALTLGGAIPTTEGRRIRAGLYRARLIAQRLGWSLGWQNHNLVLASSSSLETEKQYDDHP